jgi:hypothetical protein
MSTNHAEFKLSITKALGDQLAERLDSLTPAPLTEENIQSLPKNKGVYQLYRFGELVYIGKADATLPQRLAKHLRKLSGRVGIHLEEVTFAALSVDEDLSAVAPEKLLIDKHQGDGEAPWNNNGFGINDPGKERDTTAFDPDHFDQLYPANLDWVVDGLSVGERKLKDILKIMKKSLPYTFRYAGKPHDSIYASINITLDSPEMTADELFLLVSSYLPDPWRITALPGYVVMYPQSLKSESARKYYREGSATIPTR